MLSGAVFIGSSKLQFNTIFNFICETVNVPFPPRFIGGLCKVPFFFFVAFILSITDFLNAGLFLFILSEIFFECFKLVSLIDFDRILSIRGFLYLHDLLQKIVYFFVKDPQDGHRCPSFQQVWQILNTLDIFATAKASWQNSHILSIIRYAHPF